MRVCSEVVFMMDDDNDDNEAKVFVTFFFLSNLQLSIIRSYLQWRALSFPSLVFVATTACLKVPVVSAQSHWLPMK